MQDMETCIPSILNQNYDNFEVILVDDQSTDGSLEYAKQRFPNLIFVSCEENVGYAGGINRGLAQASGEYIAPLNIDTEVEPDWLLHMAKFLDDNPQVGAVMPKILLFNDRNKINTTAANVHFTGISFCKDLGENDDEVSTSPTRIPGVSGCSFLIRRELLEQMGGAPEECFMGNDDVILSWKINLMGYEMYCVPQSVIYHKYEMKMNPRILFLLERNRQELLLTTLKPQTLIILSPALVTVEVLITAFSLLRGKTYLGAKYRALVSVIQNRKILKERRAQNQRLRQISDFELLRRLKLNMEWKQLFSIKN